MTMEGTFVNQIRQNGFWRNQHKAYITLLQQLKTCQPRCLISRVKHLNQAKVNLPAPA